MIALLQRVKHANVIVEDSEIAAIGHGLLVLIGVQPDDDETHAEKLVKRMLGYRVFEDDQGKMNLSLMDIGGELLLVPQFTLAADTRKGMRPSFSSAATPEQGRFWFERVVEIATAQIPHVACGRFGADMQVGLVNDGPVTFWLEV